MSYRSTISRQPKQFSHISEVVSAQLRNFDCAPFREGSLVLTGIGASYEAAVVVAGELQRRGKRAAPWRAVDLMEPGNPGDAIIAFSAGGRSIEPISAIRSHANLPSVAITSEGNDPLSRTASASLRFECGPDALPSATGYTGSVMAGGLLVDALCDGGEFDWKDMPSIAADVLDSSSKKMQAALEIFRNRRAIDSVGALSGFGTAGEACLLLREAARIPTGREDTLHYLHGPMESMDEKTGVVIFGDAREIKLAHDLAEIGCSVLLVTADNAVDDRRNLVVVKVPDLKNRAARSIVDILPAQLLAAELSDAAGLTDTPFRYSQSDTKVLEAF
ncbi:SIS domain-containing protein [Mesorhizobium neociceri]|uniref:Glucosamine--fructose-6-phosphate aminotransferase n=1 Tax=Mesorhizobium neociceri TaxID=1307853 RepID=A0A838B823_9HYPH|nr:glucosamine--fructose-6-phosphate aminotransferase [Mesorhizobium neociceri]MBA1142323.1 glucosamine--fructose-6-phosphate aminotransferase [Mesorhizobium neociceri]